MATPKEMEWHTCTTVNIDKCAWIGQSELESTKCYSQNDIINMYESSPYRAHTDKTNSNDNKKEIECK